jgi:hypothetical protein
MEKSSSKLNLKPVVAILVLLLGGSLFYIYKLKTTEKQLQTEIVDVTVDKQKALDSLSILKTTYDKALEDKDLVTQKLMTERDKVVSLIEELKQSNGSLAAMKIFKVKYEKLQSNFQNMIDADNGLKAINEKLTKERDSTALIVNDQKKFIDTLATRNDQLKKKVEKAAKLVVTNIKTYAIRQKSSGEQIETTKASRTDKLKICFTIAANEIADSGEKNYYVQIIDANNNVIGEKKTDFFGTKTIEYSFMSKVKFKNQSVDVCEFLDSKGVDFVKGNYFVNLFDKSELVSKTSFELK